MSARDAAVAAADWWAKQVGAPTFRNVDDRSTGEERRSGDLAGLMQTMIATRHPVTREAGNAFAKELAKYIESQLKAQAKRGSTFGVSLGVDYGPDYELGHVAEKTGISASRFPWKSHMWVYADYVIAALGYGAEPRLVWSDPSWARPVCGTHRYEGSQSFDEICPKLRYHDDRHGDWQADPATCGGCGLGYTAHYARDRGSDFHPWTPVTPGGSS